MSIESESWSYSKGTQLRGVGLSERSVVGLQEIEPKVRFPDTTGFIYIYEAALKLLLNLILYNETLVQLS